MPELLQVAVPHAVQLVAKRPDDEGGVVAILADLLGEAAHGAHAVAERLLLILLLRLQTPQLLAHAAGAPRLSHARRC